tara:strand:- start:369 stop:554 length:186 start_codon:yes stop_codon:yes gene_type:complete
MADKFDKRRIMAEKLAAEKSKKKKTTPKKVKLETRNSKSTTNSKLVEGGEKDVERTKKDSK